MSETYGILSTLPPIVALIIALWKRQIIPALILGCLVGEFILLSVNKHSFFFVFLERTVVVAGDEGNLKLIVFSLLIGSLVTIMKAAGGFVGLIRWIESNFEPNKKKVYISTWIITVAMFFETWGSVLVAGTALKPIYDKLNIGREKLAYFIHTISINVVASIVINSWGAYYMSILSSQAVLNPFGVVISTIPFNFYSIVSLVVVLSVMTFNLDIGGMKGLKPPMESDKAEDDIRAGKASYLFIPIIVMIFSLLASLYVTGNGEILSGSGTTSVFYGVITALLILALMVALDKQLTFEELIDRFFEGVGKFIPVAFLLVFALSLGEICKELGTGIYIAQLAQRGVPTFLLPGLFFVISCLIAFSTGTSYGTFAIMFPLAIPTAELTGLHMPLLIAACISGGVFGDNTSPISDTSIVTSISTEVEVVQHVRTQLPYALISAAIAIVLFIIAGIIYS